ncbi:hypothetical protein [Sphingomonas pokkalii]|uniref:hypothetical protein n=1 Tax=Sphingomonas pokkalii TaxID=2175090 RepID=UPI001057EF74|nr:hypothetical protein [Sphingomonas pokkalii]
MSSASDRGLPAATIAPKFQGVAGRMDWSCGVAWRRKPPFAAHIVVPIMRNGGMIPVADRVAGSHCHNRRAHIFRRLSFHAFSAKVSA